MMPMSHDLRCIFVHEPKTGGTSIEKCLPVGHMKDQELRHLPALSLKKYIGEKNWEKYYKFSVVRNPFDWFVSLFMANGRGRGMDWDEYIENPWIESGMSPYQQENIQGMDKIVRFDDLEAGFEEIAAHIGSKGKLLHLNATPNKLDYRSYYTPDQRRTVTRNFRDDLARWDWEF